MQKNVVIKGELRWKLKAQSSKLEAQNPNLIGAEVNSVPRMPEIYIPCVPYGISLRSLR